MVTFVEEQFPTRISYGAAGGAGWKTTVLKTPGGFEQRISNRSEYLGDWDVAQAIQDDADVDELINFFNSVQGRLIGYRYKDFKNFTSSVFGVIISDTDQTIGTGTGSLAVFQLIKTFTLGALSIVKTIKKPVADTVIISLDDVSQPSGWTVDTATGIVTFDSAAVPGSGVVVKAGYEFDHIARFETDVQELVATAPELGEWPSVLIVEYNQK